LCKHDKKVLVR